MLWQGPLAHAEIEAPDEVGGPVEISLNTIVMFAMDDNPVLEMAREREEQMAYYAEEARAGYWPRIEFNAEGGREYINPTGGQNSNYLGKASVNVNQKLFDGFATVAEVERREELHDSLLYESLTKKQQIVMEITEYYLDVLRYQEETKWIEEFVANLDEIVSNVKKMYEAGAISKVMLDYALSRQASAYADLSKIASSLNDSVSNLEYWTGPLPKFRATEPDMLNPDKFPLEFYLRMAEENNPEIKKSEADLQAMKNQLQVERSAYYPKVDFRVKAEQGHNDGGEVGPAQNVKATFNLSYEIFDGFNRKNRNLRFESQVRELEFVEQKLIKEMRKEMKLYHNQIAALIGALKAVTTEIRSNKAVQILNEENFRLGTINAIELIEGEERLKEAFMKRAKMRRDLYMSIYSLLISATILQDEYFCESCSDETAAAE